MPNYRKKKHPNGNNRNKNKNKNKSNTASSSVKQELSESDSVGIQPNLPADVNLSHIGTTTSTATTSSDSVLEKGVIDVDDSSPSSNEEINENACNVDIDTRTCSSDSNTVLTQSSFSSSKKSTEIEQKSKSTAFDGDSTLGNSVITDTFDGDSGINSSKTGSANTKDAAVPHTAVKSATTRKSESRNGDKNRSGSERIRDGSSKSNKVQQSMSGKKSERSDPALNQPSSSSNIDPQTSQVIPSKVIVHQISKEESPQPIVDDSTTNVAKQIVHETEESKTTRHIASKKQPDQLTKLNSQQTSKKKACRTTTASLQLSKKHDGLSVIVPDTEQSSEVIVHHISLEDSQQQNDSKKEIANEESKTTSQTSPQIESDNLKQVTFDLIPKEISKVIVHQISKEDTSQPALASDEEEDSKKVTFDPIPQEISKVIVHQISKDEDEDEDSKKVTFDPIPKEISKVIVHQISIEDTTQPAHIPDEDEDSKKVTFDPIPQEISKVIPHQISKENTTQPAHLPDEDEDSKKVTFDPIPQEISKVIVHQISKEDTTQPAHGSDEDEDSEKVTFDPIPQEISKVILQQVSQNEADGQQPESAVDVIHPILQENPRPSQEKQQQTSPAESLKVIIIPISLENSTQASLPEGFANQNPVKPQEEKKFQKTPPTESPREIIIPIMVQGTTQTSEIYQQSLSTADKEEELPRNVIFEQISRDKMSEQSTIMPEQANLSPKVILHPILQNRSTQTASAPLHTPLEKTESLSNATGEESTQTKSSSERDHHPRTSFPVCRSPKVIVHQINRGNLAKQVFPFTPRSLEKLDNSSKNIANRILKDVSSELQSSFRSERANRLSKEHSTEPIRTSFPLSTKTKGKIRPGFFETNALLSETNPTDSQSKVIVHPIVVDQSECKPDQRILSLTGSRSGTDEPIIISHQISSKTSCNESEIYQSSSTLTSLERNNDQGSQSNSEKSESIQTRFPVTPGEIFPLSTDNPHHPIPYTPTPVDPETTELDFESSREESVLSQSSSTLTSGFPLTELKPTDSQSKVIVHPIVVDQSECKPDQRILSLTGSRSGIDEPIIISHQISSKTSRNESEIYQSSSTVTSLERNDDQGSQSNSEKSESIQTRFPVTPGEIFPLSTDNPHHPIPYTPTPVDPETTELDFESSREESVLSQSSSTLTSGFPLTELNPTDSQSKVIVHPIVVDQSECKPDQRILSLTGSRSGIDEPIIISHQISSKTSRNESEIYQSSSTVTSLERNDDQGSQSNSEESEPIQTRFPVTPGEIFPLSTDNPHHPIPYTPTPVDPETTELDFENSREESVLSQSSSTLTSAFSLTESNPTDSQSKVIVHPIVVDQSECKPDQRILSLTGSRSGIDEPILISHQISSTTSRNESEVCQSSSTLTSLERKDDQGNQPNSGESASIQTRFPVTPGEIFPLSTDNPHHPIPYTPTPVDPETTELDFESSREESVLSQSSSTLTSAFPLTELNPTDSQSKVIVHPIVVDQSECKPDQRILSLTGSRSGIDEPIRISHQISSKTSLNESEVCQSSSTLTSLERKDDQGNQPNSEESESIQTRFPVTPGEIFPLSTDNPHHPIPYTPTPVDPETTELDFESSREESVLSQSSSTLTSAFPLTELNPTDSQSKVIVHPIVVDQSECKPDQRILSLTGSRSGIDEPIIISHQISSKTSRNESEVCQSSSTLTSLEKKDDQGNQPNSGESASIQTRFPVTPGEIFPLSTDNPHHPIAYTPTPVDSETTELDFENSREESVLSQSSSTLTSAFPLTESNPTDSQSKVIVHPIVVDQSECKPDQRILSLTGSQSDKEEPIIIPHQTSRDDSNSSQAEERDKITPFDSMQTSEIKIHQSSREESKSIRSSSSTTSTTETEIRRMNQQIEPDVVDNIEPKIIMHELLIVEPSDTAPSELNPKTDQKAQHSNSPVAAGRTFPHSAAKKHHPMPYDFKRREIDLQTLRDKSELYESSSTLTSPFALTVTPERKDHRSQSDTNESEPIQTKFPVTSGKTFPLSTDNPHHPIQYTPTPIDSETTVIDLETLREESALSQSSSTLTSPFALTVTAERRNQSDFQFDIPEEQNTSQSPLTSFPVSTNIASNAYSSEKQQIDSSLSKSPSFPISTEKEIHLSQYIANTNFESKETNLQMLRKESKLHQSSSTLASPFALTLTPDSNDDQISQPDFEETESIQTRFPVTPGKIFPLSNDNPHHPIQYTPTPIDSETTMIDLETLREESALSQSSSTLTSPFALTVIPNKIDQRIQPELLSQLSLDDNTSENKLIDQQTSHDELISSSSSSEETVRTTIQSKSPQVVPQPTAEDQKEKVNIKEKSPKSSFFLASLESTSNQASIDKSDSSDTETLRGESDTLSDPEEDAPKVIVHQILHESPTAPPTPQVHSPKIINHQIVREKTPPPQDTGKVIIHPIVREIIADKPLGYRVESPQPDRRLMIVQKSKSFDDDDIIIQEMSDTSSAGDTDNPPVVSEAESETDTLETVDDFPETAINSRVLSVQTLPIDQEDDSSDPLSPKSQAYKNRRQQNRVALETHFLPQFFSPIFLQSIKEENSELSDSERRSECSERTDHAAAQQSDLEDDVFLDDGLHAKKADAVFPKSNLDFSKKHKHIHTNVRPPKTSVIREEAPQPTVVETKILHQGIIQEGCSSWSTDLTPQSEDAEVVYIDSASSSVADLLELDYSQGQPDEPIDVRIQTPTIDLDSVNEIFSYHRSENNERINMPPTSPIPAPALIQQTAEPPPVKEEKNMSEHILLPPLDDHVEATTTTLSSKRKTTTPTAVEHKIPDEIILEKIETVSETVAAAATATSTGDDHNNDADDDVIAVATADRVQNSKANKPSSCDSAISQVDTYDIRSVAAGFIEKMENLRELVSASLQSELDTITDPDTNQDDNNHDVSKLSFKIGEPCSDHTFKCDTTTTSSPMSSSSSTTTTTTTDTSTSTSTTSTTTTTGSHILTLHDLSRTLGDTHHLHPLGNSSSTLDRQESLDSHGSDQSHSTTQSQCTAINQGSLPHCDWNEIDTTTDTTYVSGSDTAGLASSENSSPLTTGGGRSADDTESPPIRKLRSLCTEALASLPYGEEVLEELATVAQNIGDMPYPLPQLPHIQDIEVSLRSEPEKSSSVINLTQVPPRPIAVGEKLKSPPPPPVPAPPSKYDSWLGVPTKSDPNVLVCLSPSQRSAVKNDATPDSLLDMHKKFVERRGYHEYTTKQVDAMNKENSYESVKLNKSSNSQQLPPPLPPRPQQPTLQSSRANGNGEAQTDINADDQNNHRLLAIIRDTDDSQQQHHHQQKSSTTSSSSENISRRTMFESNTTKPVTTNTSTINNTNNTNTTTTNGSGTQEEFANSPSVSKQTQERFVSESNKSESAHHEMQTSQTERTIKADGEPILGIRFPTSEYFDSIFDGSKKRFSNIETGSTPGICSQILNTKPKRYSNIESSSYESRKCIENGKVLYDVSDSNRQKFTEGEKPKDSAAAVLTSFPKLTSKLDNFSSFPYITPAASSNQVNSRTQTGDSENIMSAFKLNTQTTAPPPVPPAHRIEASPPAPPVPPLPPTLVDTTATTKTTKSTSTSESVINRNFNGETKETIFDDFRQRAKEAAAGEKQSSTGNATTKKSDVFDHEKLLKDFDELSNLLKDELESGKRRPPATVHASDVPAHVSDYNRVAKESKIQSSHVSSSSTSEQTRREQMKKLADEIDRTAEQRQQNRREMRIPIRIEKPTPTPPRSAPKIPQQPQSYEIPVRIENGTPAPRSVNQQRSYEIPVRVEQRERTRSEHQPSERSHEAPTPAERPREQPERFRRAESMFNISDTTSQRHMLHDDWMKYVGDLGSSENICKPFQREVEICYLGRRPNIRAPRLSASTSDLSSTQSFDTYGAYDVRRTANNQTSCPQQPPRRRFLSSHSMIDTTPITSCVSARRSPIRERRASLPREIHDQQLKYISSKEHQLQLEFDRLENERRQLIDEMNRAQINQRMNREAYRQRQLPPLTEDESFRQQMAEEWLHKVAEREERRLQKIIKISKINQDANFPTVPPRRVSASDIGDEFLRRVKERRSKLCMPSDSDWESGAESQPIPRTDGSRSENEEPPPITVLEGKSEADIKQLPKHLREFAKLTNQAKEEHREEINENSSCSAIKKSSIVTTVKTSNTNSQNRTTPQEYQSLQQDVARVRDLEQLSQGKRQKLVTILRHKKPAESTSSAGDYQPIPPHAAATTAAAPQTAGASGAGGVTNLAKRRKQTRFLLTPNRRSWSESDLLREIDKELVLAKGFLYANGVWTPKNQTPSSSRTNLNEFQPYNTTRSDKISENRSSSACERQEKDIPNPPPPPLWTPQPERKRFRPVHFESPTLQRRYVRQQSTPSEAPPPPWSYTNAQPFPGYQSQSCTNLSHKNTAIPWPPPPQPVEAAPSANGTVILDDYVVDEDNDFAPTTSIAEKIRSFERSTSNSELHRPFVRHNPYEKPATLRPNEVIYSVKNEYMSEPETEYDKPKKMAQLSRRQYDGIGPTTRDGMPVVLRSEVKEPNQHEWYKRIFQTIHKQKNPGRYPYKSNGYMSEPEPNYDSDYSTVKYRTLERRRLQSTGTGTGSARAGNDSQDDTVYGTMPNPVKSGQGSYKVQPGRIENYITGHSSVSEKEKKEWWDEVMDIFNGWLKDNDPLPRIFIDFANEVEQFQLDQQKLAPHYTEGNLSRALLKEQGYTSDSNLVFRKKDVPQQQSPLSPVEQKQVYKIVQAGGQPPLLGFRKPAPEKPKETEFEYLPITPTLTKIRVHSKEAMSKKSQTTHAAQRELICYPITNLSRPIDMFAPFPKHVPSFIPINQPPLPPNRKSSRARTTSMALKISSSEVRRPTSANSSRHEACFQTKDAISPPPPAKPTKYGTITLRKTVKRTEPLLRSKSAGAVVNILTAAKEEKTKDGRVSRKQQTVRLSSCSPVRSASRLTTLRTSSRSPVAFGRSVSKERSFAEEKKRIEETLPSIRTDFTASTNILRDPRLKSPDQVKRAVRSYAYPMERSKSAPRVLSPAKPAMSSYMSTYVVRRGASPLRKEVSAVKRGQTSSSMRSPVKAPVVVRSKSQSSKLSEKITSKPMTKTSSTVSLARTSSTFSVDSTTSKVKTIPKKQFTITSTSTRTIESEKAKRKPVTISSSKSDSNVLRKIKENSEAKEKIIKSIPSQQKIVRTDQFFTNLFMRDNSPKKDDTPIRRASVHDKTRYWNTMSLPSKKSMNDSKHLSYQQCRSLSPPMRPHYVEEYESLEHFNSDDEASEFGDRSGRTEDLVWQYEQRSRSEPRATKPVSDIARPESPAPIFPREFSPTREIRVPQTREMRSPSRRRIQSFRGVQRSDTGKIIRASSLSSADDRTKRSLYHCDDISHSANSLEYIERHSPSCRFKNSDRFIDLNRFYSTLERVGQLERATSATSLKTIRKEGEAMDFEEWRKIRFHERAERELNYLVGRLKEDQKQRDFLFRPKDVEDVKWSGNKDLALRSKDKSVEDLRENFEKKIHQEWLNESKRMELESKKDTYKPYWRGSSVADLASSMEVKYNPESGSFGVQKVKSETISEKPLCLSNRLISTLSKDQVSKITQQLNDIYNASEAKTKPDVTEEYVITVDKHTPANALKVRCNSSISKEELIGPVLRRKEVSAKPPQSKTFDRLSREVGKFENELTETEKRRLSQTFSREIQGKTRSGSPVMLARETRGAIAAENAKTTLPDIPPPPPLPKNLIETKKTAPAKPKRKAIEDQKKKTHDGVEEDSIKIETLTVEMVEKPEDAISKKIQYFEERKFEEPAKTIYHAREDSSPDEDEVMRLIEENIKTRTQSGRFHHQELSSSVTDLKDLYGERESSRINFPLPRPPPPPDETIYHETKQEQHRSTSLTLSASRDGSLENVEALFRSRSISPQATESSYLHRVHTGDVRKIKDKFESLGRPKKKKHFFAISPLRKVRSDPELSNDGSKDTFKTVVREHEVGDVSWITHKFEVRNSAGRGRSRIRKPGSPIQRMPLRKEDRLMPHIDIISKTASLKQEIMKSRSPSPARQQATLHAGEVERIRCIFETSPDRESPLLQPHLGTSSPELRDISAHLTASWIAHKYPKPLDNDLRSPPLPEHEMLEKSVSLPIKGARRHEGPYRSRSISPPKAKQIQPKSATITSILKPRYDFFANQKFDPSIHRPKARYVPDSGDGDDWKKTPPNGIRKTSAVKFKDSDDVPPPPVPPTKGVSIDSNGFSNLESPNRYFESDVNIHYKTPIRYEYKEPIPEEELAIRQAESMQKLYQEERRRKYLQELQDMNSRRHTDNFTSTQKSPIPLNRYDDFNSDLAPKSPNSSNYPKTIARALYNFQGQTARELTFKKGDVIYIRRQIDKNWYEGEHNAMIGLLPSNYVELITKDGVRQPPKKPSEGQARAKYNFQAQSAIELSLNKGEHVTLTRRVDDNWFEGKIANRKGIFPVSYVEVLADIGVEDKAVRAPASQSQSSSSVRPSLDTLRTNINNEFNSLTSNGQPPNGILRETRTLHKTDILHVDTNTEPVAYRALYKYRPQNTDELELQEGDIVYVLEKCDDGWFVGTSQRSGCFGTFPGNYVERV